MYQTDVNINPLLIFLLGGGCLDTKILLFDALLHHR
jgi:hypothetical protein